MDGGGITCKWRRHACIVVCQSFLNLVCMAPLSGTYCLLCIGYQRMLYFLGCKYSTTILLLWSEYNVMVNRPQVSKAVNNVARRALEQSLDGWMDGLLVVCYWQVQTALQMASWQPYRITSSGRLNYCVFPTD